MRKPVKPTSNDAKSLEKYRRAQRTYERVLASNKRRNKELGYAQKYQFKRKQSFKKLQAITKSKKSKTRWALAELAYLKEMYPVRPEVDIAKYLGRSYRSVGLMAKRLGLRRRAR